MTDPRHNLRRLHASPERTHHHPCNPGRGQTGLPGMGTSRLRQEPDRAAGRDREPEPRRGRGEARRSGRSPLRSRR